MPIRLAHRIIDLDRVPLMKDMPSVQAVKDIYISSFVSLINEPKIDSSSSESEFAQKLEALYQRHSNVLVQMARGAYELRQALRSGDIRGANGENGIEFEKMNACHEFLDRFYVSRIGIRILAGQYLALRGPPLKDYVGLICQHTSPYAIVQHAVDDATFMCNRKFGDAPEVIISGRMDLTFAYVPTHLHYILLELLKNALRATVEHYGVDAEWPHVEVIIADKQCNEDVVIKISDKGGGIKRSNTKKIWSYLYTTADPAIQEGMIAFDNDKDHSVDAPLAGLGYGLPISRSYARYFGGDLSVISMEGYGTDAFIHMKRLGNSREPLPT
uniref:Protein-serine/threonine kinase n=1 Tax=Eucampia antarctica TaxID=49252 RepID=A0A7S2RCC2_9STRA|mmetsp:Transcript_20151/g.19398  ORF Transcript_20151/g.19398 Transcript_20151/m.19398 type:complete len:329 (+) Transcript_20151:485-1471(+)|eukprot:CAMPEP_0197841330 /NCGR_PEP_ID=MMETSP1437-20131217/46112_1 /TAXON_ID=49252 ORGANISM="Eucampia antarctica, Strain CCMP1452" /NCGR_SAMPLE_ID=MMETSP1437 /ASSEMBLY_ACC=CAM_ASM_001096 /LENGTH=328 /DNA_ID=CAMNT_0043451061 /DNA_START=485 /DNA_END=1471 /DNA_ORIENTATION=+